jgi:hypothetical protein
LRLASSSSSSPPLQLTATSLDGLVLPKVHTAADLLAIDEFISRHASEENRGEDKLKLVVSIESPLGLLNMREITGVSKRIGALLVRFLLFSFLPFFLQYPDSLAFLLPVRRRGLLRLLPPLPLPLPPRTPLRPSIPSRPRPCLQPNRNRPRLRALQRRPSKGDSEGGGGGGTEVWVWGETVYSSGAGGGG